jgi:type III restriction enzyme
MLHDGRILVVEYKGKAWSEMKDAEDKRALGSVWESRSHGQCLFIMPDGPDLEAIGKKIRSS